MVEGLLAKSWSLRYENPSEMLRYAMLAWKRAEGLEARTHGCERVLDLRARALAELGNAYRVLDQLDAAEEKLEEAGRFAELGTRDEALRIRLLELDAALAAARRQFKRAAIYLAAVYEYSEARGDRQLAGRALIQRGLYVGYDGDPEQGLHLLEEGLSQVDEAQEPELVQTAIHNKLLFIIECGRFDEARKFRFRNTKLLNRDNGQVNRARLRDLEGRIEAGLGRPDRAEVIFREAKQEFEALERPYLASITGLDLAAVLLAQNRPDEAAEIVMAAHRVFQALRIKREALAAVLVLFYAIRQGEETVRMAEEVAAYLRLLERNPNARFDPQPF
jgi:tetratricopeptide (TPR) repeat protein